MAKRFTPSLDRAPKRPAASLGNIVLSPVALSSKRPNLNERRFEKRSARFSAGFTLIELLITITITVLLSAILIGYSRVGNTQIILFKDQARIVNAFLRAKSLALQIFTKSIPACGYGIHFDSASRSFILFRDVADPCSDSDNRYSGSAEDLEVQILDSQLKFSNLQLIDFLFIPPEPTVIIDGDTIKTGDFTIEINMAAGGNSKKIKVNHFGQVSAE